MQIARLSAKDILLWSRVLFHIPPKSPPHSSVKINSYVPSNEKQSQLPSLSGLHLSSTWPFTRNWRGRLFGIKTLIAPPHPSFCLLFLPSLFLSTSLFRRQLNLSLTASSPPFRKLPLLVPFQEVNNTFNSDYNFFLHPLLFAFIVPSVRAVNTPTPSLTSPLLINPIAISHKNCKECETTHAQRTRVNEHTLYIHVG